MGYSEKFLDGVQVHLPDLRSDKAIVFQQVRQPQDKFLLNYINYSVLQNPIRRFPFYTASNIDGKLFKEITRKELFGGKGDKWKKDESIDDTFQYGNELYTAHMSNFDKGHLTKREDVQWGETLEEAIAAAESTFHFTNAIPQLDRLNRGIWRKIEDYILHQEVLKNNMKISLFTGPIFLEDDPNFVTRVKGKVVKLPVLFWKVIFYIKDNELHRTAFLTGQRKLMLKRGIIRGRVSRGAAKKEDNGPFMNFGEANTYQVNVDFVERYSGLKFQEAIENYKEKIPAKIIIDKVNVRSFRRNDPESFKVNVNIIL